ncbi:MGMT family protein [Thiomicrorhabdus sp. HH1]|uniref:MGMT family protein n=1 Tax=Thiomicrorhabdus heinhorstiae TaxID=2748010 RepID=A0ABS0BX30_9GAMM|nr:MGMT family protein [Thiomicrorhabdus heinhorstiae]
MESFNQRCYRLIERVPPGKICTYSDVAHALGGKAYQAVGNAMANNPHPITTPCHRVVKSNGEIGNYAFGIEAKKTLLEKEGIVIHDNKIEHFEEVRYRF